jgi:chromosome segregation ATPase
MGQLTPLDVEPGDQDSTAKSLASLKDELVAEKTTCEMAQVEAETLTRVVEELKKTANQFAAQVPSLEEKVKYLDNKIIDLLTELCTRELCLERMIKANDDYKSQNTRLTKKFESKNFIVCIA